MKSETRKLRIVWVDDMRNPHLLYPFSWRKVVPREFLKLCGHPAYGPEPGIIWLKSYDEWLKWATEVWHQEDDDEYITCFCLDHDLGYYDKSGKEKTGVDVAKDIIDELIISGRKLPYYECHSSNPTGKDNIISVFETFKKYFHDT